MHINQEAVMSNIPLVEKKSAISDTQLMSMDHGYDIRKTILLDSVKTLNSNI